MVEKVLKGVSVFMGILTVVVCISLFFFPDIHAKSVAAKEARLAEQQIQVVANTVTTVEQIQPAEEEIDAQLKIELPEGTTEDSISIENDYLNQVVYIRFPNGVDDYFSSYQMSGKSDHIAGLDYYKDQGDGVIELDLDKVYELKTQFADNELYLDFLSTHDVYDKVVVVDAGHGSRAVGAVKQGVCEKDVDLQIVLALKAYMEEHSTENIGVYYTRLDDSNPTLEQRANLANKADADLFISIHNNSSSSGNMTSTHGTQVMYSESDDSELSSQRFANICLDQMTSALGSKSIGLMKGDSIYIIRTSQVPVALIEVGFMTNTEELANLQDPEYQAKAAEGIYNSIMQAFEEGY